jgi:glycosyltransferase involved in cell wall biosynthesis
MKLVVVSHKECWVDPASPSGYGTIGGFPFQMRTISELFDQTTLVVPVMDRPSRSGSIPLTGHNVSVLPVEMPAGAKLRRKIALLPWLPRNLPTIWRAIYEGDGVHTPIPGDIGAIGAFLAFVLRKPLFVRYCQNWLMPKTAADRVWKWFFERFAGGKNVMLATGGASEAPPCRNPNVRWIFATSLTERDLRTCKKVRNPPPRGRVRLIIVCRQETGKGTEVVIRSLPLLLRSFSQIDLDVVGDGDALSEFRELSLILGVNKHVRFHGNVDHERVISLLQQADLFCFPTRSEGFPKSVLEALACGVPVITTRVSVLPQLIGNGCGVLIDKATPEAIAQAVRESLSNAQGYRKMSSKAVETANQYSLERWGATINDLLQKAWGVLRTDGSCLALGN